MKKQGRKGKTISLKSSKIFNPFARFLALIGPGSRNFLITKKLPSSGIYLYHEESTRALDLMETHRCKLLAEFVSLYTDMRFGVKRSLIKVLFLI